VCVCVCVWRHGIDVLVDDEITHIS
jgi:hypothetical protein